MREYIEKSANPIPEYLILQRKALLQESERQVEVAPDKRKKRKRSSGKSEGADLLIKRRPDKKLRMDVSEKAKKNKTEQLTSLPYLTDFWKMQSLESASSIYKKAVGQQIVQIASKPLPWPPHFIQKIHLLENQKSSLPIYHLKNYQMETLDALRSLSFKGLSGIMALDMGLGKTITFSARIAQYIAEGGSGNILVMTPKTTLEQTKQSLIGYLEDAQLTAALSTWRFWNSLSKQEQLARADLIIRWIKRLDSSPPFTDKQNQCKRYERLGLAIAYAPQEIQDAHAAKFQLIASLPRHLSSDIPWERTCQDFNSFKNMISCNAYASVVSLADARQARIVCATYPMLMQDHHF
jgi:SNF2 family DNA or RNA helicase